MTGPIQRCKIRITDFLNSEATLLTFRVIPSVCLLAMKAWQYYQIEDIEDIEDQITFFYIFCNRNFG